MTFLFLLLLLILSWAFFFPLFPFILVATAIYLIVKLLQLLFAPVEAVGGIITSDNSDNYDNPWLYNQGDDD